MLLKPRYVTRFRQVAAVLIRHGFSDVLAMLDLQRFLPGRLHQPHTPEEKQHQRARSLRIALEEIGTTYIKLGQLLSTRPDLLPDTYIEELALLQDRVEPFPFEAVRAAVEAELDGPLEHFFAEFDREPVASASLSQVHRAVIEPQPGDPDVREVAVKVLRPGVEPQVELDLEILAELASLIARTPLLRDYDVEAIVDQLGHTLRDELDLRHEARHAKHFRQALAGRVHLRVPEVVERLSTRRMHVATYIHGTRIHDLAKDRHLTEAADELWRSFLEHMLVAGRFLCDPHPGNFLVDADDRLVLLDHGMVAHLSRGMQAGLTTLLLALADLDGEAVADACIDIGLAGRDFRERPFRAEIAQMVARYGGLPLRDLDLGKVVLELVRASHRNGIVIPGELMLFGKTLLYLESVCRTLDPDMDPVTVMSETAGSLLGAQLRRDFTPRRGLRAAIEARTFLAEIPTSVRRILRRAAANDFRVGLELGGREELQQAIQTIASRVSLALLTAALIVGSALVLNVKSTVSLWGYPVFGLAGFLLAAGLGIYLVLKIILGDRY